MHLFEYPPEAVVEVVLGARASQKTRDSIKAILGDKVVWPNVKLYQAGVDARHYRLNYEEVII
ncbi:hypothetical protein D3C72_2302570 [compost metagenome]